MSTTKTKIMNKGMGMSHEGHEHAFENEHRPIETLMVVCSAPTVRMQTTELGFKLACQFIIKPQIVHIFHHCHSFHHKSRDVGPFCLLSRRTLTGRCSNSTSPFFFFFQISLFAENVKIRQI